MVERGLLSISEFAQFTGIPRSKLIYYDEIGLFSPIERGENNYRYYGLYQMITANFVNDITSFGVPLKEVIELEKNRTPETIREVLKEGHQQNQKKIQELKESQDLIWVLDRLIKAGIEADEKKIEVKTLESFNLIVGDENDYQGANSFYPAWIAFLAASQKKSLNLKFPVGGMFDTYQRFFDQPEIPSRFYFINPKGKTVRQEGQFLVGFNRGFYGDIGDLPKRLMNYAKEHDLTLGSPVYNTYLLDELSMINTNDYLMQASIPIIGGL